MTPALQTAGLIKRFGGFVATNDVSLDVATGARHALIGPNGAGKTTLINLLTGFLEPTAGTVMLNGENVTHLAQHRRVKRGLARTFQINRLFAEMTVLQSVVLAVCQRRGVGARFFRPVGAYGEAIDSAAAILARLRLLDLAHQRTSDLAYGKQRLIEIALALAAEPSVLLLDEPAAGVPTNESRELFETIAQLPDDVTILLIEHDMDLVFRFADRISVLVAGAVLTENTPAAIAADPRVREVYLGEIRVAELLQVEGVWAGYGSAIVLEDVSLALGAGGSLALLGRNGMGKTTLLATLMGATHQSRGSIRFDGADFAAVPSHRRAQAGIGWVPQERDIFASLTVEENLTVVARPGPWSLRKVYATFPRLRERRANMGNLLSGGEQQMLAIGRALMLNPRLLLLDEPLEGLAPLIGQELLQIIAGMVREGSMAVILVEQHAHQILPVTRDAMVLERGRVAYSGTSDQLIADPALLDRWLGVAAH